MRDTDEIKAKFERLYDAVQVKLKETEGTDDEMEWQDIELYLNRVMEILNGIEGRKRALEPDPGLLIFIEREEKRNNASRLS